MDDLKVAFVITEEQADRVRATLNGFRYGGMVHSTRHIDNGESLVQWLEAFSKVLVNVADDATHKDEELSQIKSDLEAAGRLFTRMHTTAEPV